MQNATVRMMEKLIPYGVLEASLPIPITNPCFFSVIIITMEAYLILLQMNQV